MDHYKRKRKYCTNCKEEFSNRYFKRHLCKDNNVTDVEESRNYEPIPEPMAEEMPSTSSRKEDYSQAVDPEPTFESDNVPEDISSDSEEGTDIEDEELVEMFMGESEGESEMPTETDRNREYVQIILKLLFRWQAVFFISDMALSFIIMLIKSIFYLGSFSSSFIAALYKSFPSTLYQANSSVHFKKDNFKKYVVCPKCFSLYDFSQCLQIIEGKNVSKKCNNVVQPNHKLANFRKPCGEILFKSVTVNGKITFVAKKTYCYKSLKESIHRLVKKKGFENLCEKWRHQTYTDDVLSDVYDGNVWKEFNGEKFNFFTEPNNFGLMLNVDWFQPFKYSNYSVGAIYLSVLNLPREERFKRNNIILVGLIPDCKTEPPTNTFLQPLVDELQEAWVGYHLDSYTSPSDPVSFRLALLCVGCDVPASRKLCGFLGHSATLGCNKCMKRFEGVIGQKNYGGFNVREWVERDKDSHMNMVKEIMKSKTKTKKEELEKKYGVRYSVLLELEYFDPIRMTIIDPMHNLFLGTAKRMMTLWKDKKVLLPDHFEKIQEKISGVYCPSDIGKLPKKFASSYGSFNADQWKNWTIMFSVYALKDLLPNDHFDYWRKFVLACKFLCSRSLTKNHVKVAHLLLISFCESVERAFGDEVITPNIHLHAHLDKCLYDFGPVYAFWLFSFERENGILGAFPTNNRFVELQLMRKFLKTVHVVDIDCKENIGQDFGPEFERIVSMIDSKDRGTLAEMNMCQNISLSKMSSRNVEVSMCDWTLGMINSVFSHSTLKNCFLNERDFSYLKHLYQVLYPNVLIENIEVCNTFRSTESINVFGNIIGTKRGRSNRSSMIIAHWYGNNGQISSFENMDLKPRPGQVEKIILHNILIEGKSHVHCLARVKWFCKVNETMKNYFGKPVEVWKANMYEIEGPASFIPIQRIKSKFVYAFENLQGINTIVVIPRERFL
ncbi:uncharacterized protein LOC133197961 [Saccostrea echinata]|uniref:uncharacterized protein LOC133197961 n=1 Tax=Saccostrea echinata TaxID=191078 RepID=UPI002A839B84|nr:uncharacterized protein LOC133197961 [Saccostrea echinata]